MTYSIRVIANTSKSNFIFPFNDLSYERMKFQIICKFNYTHLLTFLGYAIEYQRQVCWQLLVTKIITSIKLSSIRKI